MLRTPTAIGLDIGGRTIQLVALAAGKSAPQLVAALSLELDPNRTYTRDELTEQIRTLAHAARARGPTVLAIGGNVATVQLLSFPKTTEAQLRRMVDIEAQRLAGLSPEEMVHDYVALPTDKTPDQKALVALCRAPAIYEQITLASEADIEAEDVTISTMALFNAFAFATSATAQFAGPPKAGEVTALVEIGRDATNLAIESDGALQFVRSFPNAGNSFTVAAAEAEQLNFTEAERWKTEQGEVPDTETPLGRFARRQAALYHAAASWLNELNTTLAYYLSTRGTGVNQVDRFIFCGGAAQLRGLVAFAEKRLGKSVTLGQPLQAFPALPQAAHLPAGVTQAELTDPRFAVAMGLALQGLGLAAEPLSLLPARVRAERIAPDEGKKWVAVGALSVAVAICATLWAATDYWLHRRQQIEQQASLERTKSLVKSLKEQKAKLELAEQMIAPILRTANRSQVYVETLRALSQAKPRDDWVALAADAESYFYKPNNPNDNQVPQLPDTMLPLRDPRGPPQPPKELGAQVQPLSTLIVEGYALSPSAETVKDFADRLEGRYYTVLNVSRKATDEEIRKAYERLLKVYDTAAKSGDRLAEGKIKDLNRAYAVLSDPQRRADYNRCQANPPIFKRVDTLPIDRRMGDATKDAVWDQYRMSRFTLELTLVPRAEPAPSAVKPAGPSASATASAAKSSGESEGVVERTVKKMWDGE